MSKARILVCDIERVPAWTKRMPVWDMRSLQNRRLSPDDIEEWGRTICMAYQWLDERAVQFTAEWHEGGRQGFLQTTHDLYDEADMIVGHNSKNFDTEHLQGEWALEGLGPASPVKHFDTLLEARKHFNYEANHLDTLTKRFGIPSKTDKYRIDVAMGAVAGDVAMQRKIERYNRGDVKASKGLYLYLRPWGSVNLGVFSDDLEVPRCPACESLHVQRRGYARSGVGRYPRFQCQTCGSWSKGKKTEGPTVELRPL